MVTVVWIALLVGVGALIAGLVTVSRRREDPHLISSRAQGGELRSRASSSTSLTPSATRDVRPTATPEILIAPVSDPAFPDVYMATGDPAVIAELGGEALQLGRKAARRVAAANLGVNAANSYAQATTTLFRFSDATNRALSSGSELMTATRSGLSIGVMRAADTKKITGTAELVTATGTTTLTAAASLGTAVALAAIQMQLNAISEQLEQLDAKVDDLVRLQRLTQESALRSAVESVQDQYVVAQEAGEVTDRMMTPIAGRRQDLDQHIKLLTSLTRDRLVKLRGARTQKQRLEVLAAEGFNAVQDICALVVVSRAWAMYQSLHAANLLSGDPEDLNSTVDHAAADVVVQQIRVRLARIGEQTRELAYEMDRTLHLAVKAPGTVTLGERVGNKVQHQKFTHEETQALAKAMRAILDDAQIPLPPVPALPSIPEFGESRDPTDHEWRLLLPYILRTTESPQLLIHGLGAGGNHNMSTKPSVLLITNQRAIGLRRSQFEKTGMLQLDTPLDNIKSAKPATAYREEVLRLILNEGLRIGGGNMFDITISRDQAEKASAAIVRVLEDTNRRAAPIGPSFAQDPEALVSREIPISQSLQLDAQP